MGIRVDSAADKAPNEREALRRVYQDQLRDYREEATEAESGVNAAQKGVDALSKAQQQFVIALNRLATLQGKMAALRELAGRDNINLG